MSVGVVDNAGGRGNPYRDLRNGKFASTPVSAEAKELAAATLRKYRAQGKSSGGGLNITKNAPPKGRPVVLVYGGAFNPPHEGHTQSALQTAQRTLASAGYTVDRSIVVPTADKLLAGKQMKETYRLDLEARGRLARVAFPDEIDGSPVEVRIEPSQEVERAEGKPRRTDLAAWAQKQYPNASIINVTGEDASVPGAPEQHPSLYTGEVGSNHEGFAYLTMPRPEGSFSSSEIRAAADAGTKIPGMDAKSARAYREELARRKLSLN